MNSFYNSDASHLLASFKFIQSFDKQKFQKIVSFHDEQKSQKLDYPDQESTSNLFSQILQLKDLIYSVNTKLQSFQTSSSLLESSALNVKDMGQCEFNPLSLSRGIAENHTKENNIKPNLINSESLIGIDSQDNQHIRQLNSYNQELLIGCSLTPSNQTNESLKSEQQHNIATEKVNKSDTHSINATANQNLPEQIVIDDDIDSETTVQNKLKREFKDKKAKIKQEHNQHKLSILIDQKSIESENEDQVIGIEDEQEEGDQFCTYVYIGWLSGECTVKEKEEYTNYFFRICDSRIKINEQFYRLWSQNYVQKEYPQILIQELIVILKRHHLSKVQIVCEKDQKRTIFRHLFKGNNVNEDSHRALNVLGDNIKKQFQKAKISYNPEIKETNFEDLEYIYLSSLEEIDKIPQRIENHSQNTQKLPPLTVDHIKSNHYEQWNIINSNQYTPQTQYEVKAFLEYQTRKQHNDLIPSNNPFYYSESKPRQTFCKDSMYDNSNQSSLRIQTPQSEISSFRGTPSNSISNLPLRNYDQMLSSSYSHYNSSERVRERSLLKEKRQYRRGSYSNIDD